jgi:hypothetical protein
MREMYLHNYINFKPLLKEDVNDSISSFLDKIESKHKLSEELRNKIEDFIEKSGCEKIEFAKFKFPALGVAVHDGVLINEMALHQKLETLIFVIFHEIAHHVQVDSLLVYSNSKRYSLYVKNTLLQ